jgi:plasmid stabilization system protein ParE
MVKLIRWEAQANETFKDIAFYLQDEYSHNVAMKFAENVYEKLDLLTLYPEIGRPSLIDSTVRMVKIGKSHLMFYSFDGYELVIIDFFNTRQDPNKRKY